MQTRKGTVRQVTTITGKDGKPHIQNMSLIYGDGGGSIPVPVPFLGGCGNPETPSGSTDPQTKVAATFFGFIAVPRQGDEVAVHHMGTRPVATTSATTGAFAAPNMGAGTAFGVDARFPNLVNGETGQFDGDGKRVADVFHSDGSTTLFDRHSGCSITVDPTGQIMNITAPGGLTITGTVNIVGSLSINGVPVTAP